MPTNTPGYYKKKRPNGKTNYEYYFGTKKAISDRSTRNKARRKAIKMGLIKPGDKKEVHHKRGISGGNGKSNLRAISRTTNRRLGAAKSTRVKKRK